MTMNYKDALKAKLIADGLDLSEEMIDFIVGRSSDVHYEFQKRALQQMASRLNDLSSQTRMMRAHGEQIMKDAGDLAKELVFAAESSVHKAETGKVVSMITKIKL